MKSAEKSVLGWFLHVSSEAEVSQLGSRGSGYLQDSPLKRKTEDGGAKDPVRRQRPGGGAKDPVEAPKTRWRCQRPGGGAKELVEAPKSWWRRQRPGGGAKDPVEAPKTRWRRQTPSGGAKHPVEAPNTRWRRQRPGGGAKDPSSLQIYEDLHTTAGIQFLSGFTLRSKTWINRSVFPVQQVSVVVLLGIMVCRLQTVLLDWQTPAVLPPLSLHRNVQYWFQKTEISQQPDSAVLVPDSAVLVPPVDRRIRSMTYTDGLRVHGSSPGLSRQIRGGFCGGGGLVSSDPGLLRPGSSGDMGDDGKLLLQKRNKNVSKRRLGTDLKIFIGFSLREIRGLRFEASSCDMQTCQSADGGDGRASLRSSFLFTGRRRRRRRRRRSVEVYAAL
ncbi:hypothetical protein FQA47_002547 [Oryzias melastigma]|uniref:Uncharacterized protein n=1 Tax=Oryzias melastigma TaxID=30732 RepID=A0A834CAQ0_ORYME|nr:hypothetical protein FQA47_002547 [Oryzias melastigma]